MWLNIAILVTPAMTIMGFICGVKMAQGAERRTIARLQRENLELEDRLRTAQGYISVMDASVTELINGKSSKSVTYIIEEAV